MENRIDCVWGLGVKERRAEVERLTLEGVSCAEIAKRLAISSRTAQRDREAIRLRNAEKLDGNLVSRQVSSLIMRSEQAAERLRRIANQKDCPGRVRVKAEYGAWRVTLELAKRLQSLGFLPTAK
jgi:transposase